MPQKLLTMFVEKLKLECGPSGGCTRVGERVCKSTTAQVFATIPLLHLSLSCCQASVAKWDFVFFQL